ncbi:hypothetical protein FPQ18DRAFT_268070 [Pyronema domesticum]|uniref:Uncharacterized protein n=1 Tax=Pyronema omphalodes (strain CBS 100304) TaxID=1076935 RepID=U4LHZ1_PYROM|nr:hypothetical protein FPQ18DRAFT_268070 [Pyronema domesticum]CCX31739.1 Similar to conserved hypothetical protein [Aspergillus clavatus NRRL 1]; acc. no. XP_001273790 [Pyronema omphalodes CBS 100304]
MKFLFERKSKYTSVSSFDADSESSSITSSPPHKNGSKVKNGLLVVLAIGWMVTLFLYVEKTIATQRPYTPIPSSAFRRVSVVFQHDERYVGPSDEATDHWNDLIAGHDALFVEDPKKYGLPEGIVASYEHPNKTNPPDNRFYVISQLHQLHCLAIIRWNYWQAAEGKNMSEIRDAANYKLHVNHCFEYLRQSMMCGGDIIVEGYSALGHATSVTGWGTRHSCIDFQELRRFQIDQEIKYNHTWMGIR